MDDPAERIGRAMSWFASEDEPVDESVDTVRDAEVMGAILDDAELMREMIVAALLRDPRVAYLGERLQLGPLSQDDWRKVTDWLDGQL